MSCIVLCRSCTEVLSICVTFIMFHLYQTDQLQNMWVLGRGMAGWRQARPVPSTLSWSKLASGVHLIHPAFDPLTPPVFLPRKGGPPNSAANVGRRWEGTNHVPHNSFTQSFSLTCSILLIQSSPGYRNEAPNDRRTPRSRRGAGPLRRAPRTGERPGRRRRGKPGVSGVTGAVDLRSRAGAG